MQFWLNLRQLVTESETLSPPSLVATSSAKAIIEVLQFRCCLRLLMPKEDFPKEMKHLLAFQDEEDKGDRFTLNLLNPSLILFF